MKRQNRALIPSLLLVLALVFLCMLPIGAAAAEGDAATITFSTPSGVDKVNEIATTVGSTVSLPEATAPTGYTFVGWAEAHTDGEVTEAPAYTAAGEYTVTGSKTFYAMYQNSNLITDISELSTGMEIIIAAKDADVALSTVQKSNNRGQTALSKNTAPFEPSDDVQTLILEKGTIDNTYAFNTGSGYLYAASSSSNYLRTEETLSANSSWSINISSDGTATVIAQGTNTRNVLQHNSSSSLFACYGSASQKAICLLNTVNSYTTFNCEHANQTTVSTPSNCTVQGSIIITCDDCGVTISQEIIPVDPTKHHCNEGDYCLDCFISNPEKDLSGRYYISAKKDDGNQYFACGSGTSYFHIYNNGQDIPNKVTAPDKLFTFVIEKNTDDSNTYVIYSENRSGEDKYIGWKSGNSAIFVDKNSSDIANVSIYYSDDGNYYNFKITKNEETRALEFNFTTPRVAWYKETQEGDLTLIPVEQDFNKANFTGASLNAGSDLSLLYYVALEAGEDISDYSVRFTRNGNVVTVNSYTEKDGEYVFAYTGITPQCMGDVVKAELLKDGEAVATKTAYSVKQYALDFVESVGSNNADEKNVKILSFLANLLKYGEAAQNYTGYKTGELVTADVKFENKFVASEGNLDAGDVEDVNVTNKTSGNLAIVSAGLRFDYVNKLYVKFTAESLDGVSIKFGDYNATATITDLGNGTYIAYSDAIAATELGNYVTVTLTNGESTATVDYSAYAYVSAKWGDEVEVTALEALVRALYFYGKAASALV